MLEAPGLLPDLNAEQLRQLAQELILVERDELTLNESGRLTLTEKSLAILRILEKSPDYLFFGIAMLVYPLI